MRSFLPRTTERPVRKRGDEPRTISTQTLAKIVRDECFDLPVRAAPHSHGRKYVVRGLQMIKVLPNRPVGGVQSVVGWCYCAADS